MLLTLPRLTEGFLGLRDDRSHLVRRIERAVGLHASLMAEVDVIMHEFQVLPIGRIFRRVDDLLGHRHLPGRIALVSGLLLVLDLLRGPNVQLQLRSVLRNAHNVDVGQVLV